MHEAPSDQDLMKRFCRRRDLKAFELLVHRWDRPVVSFLAKASGNREAAEDLRQEVFLRVYKYAGTYKPGYPFTTWLFRIASNVLATWRAKQARERRFEWPPEDSAAAADVADAAPGPRERAALGEISDEVDAAVARLSAPERELILFRLGMNLSYREIGAILDTPETTIKSRFYGLLGRLRKSLGQTAAQQQTQRH